MTPPTPAPQPAEPVSERPCPQCHTFNPSCPHCATLKFCDETAKDRSYDATRPEWKQNILKHSGEPTCSVPRSPVVVPTPPSGSPCQNKKITFTFGKESIVALELLIAQGRISRDDAELLASTSINRSMPVEPPAQPPPTAGEELPTMKTLNDRLTEDELSNVVFLLGKITGTFPQRLIMAPYVRKARVVLNLIADRLYEAVTTTDAGGLLQCPQAAADQIRAVAYAALGDSADADDVRDEFVRRWPLLTQLRPASDVEVQIEATRLAAQAVDDKAVLDSIAATLYGWPANHRNTYRPYSLPGMVATALAQVATLASQLEAIQGVLADAGTVLAERLDGDYAASVRELVRQKEKLREALEKSIVWALTIDGIDAPEDHYVILELQESGICDREQAEEIVASIKAKYPHAIVSPSALTSKPASGQGVPQ